MIQFSLCYIFQIGDSIQEAKSVVVLRDGDLLGSLLRRRLGERHIEDPVLEARLDLLRLHKPLVSYHH